MNLIDHLHSRYFDTSFHKFWKDDIDLVVTFPLYNLSSDLTGYQSYRPLKNKIKNNDHLESRYFTYRNKDDIGVWGLESWNLSNVLFVTEGIFDACRLTYFKYSAIALLSNNPNVSTKRWIWTIRAFRPVVTICDSGTGGKKLANLGHNTYTMSTGDLGSATQDQVRDIITKFTETNFKNKGIK
jgi:hypothetical protein